MKKIWCVLLAAALLGLFLTACGDSNADIITGGGGEPSQSSAQDSPHGPALPQAPAAAPQPAERAAYTPGQQTENGYRSDWMGLEYTLPSGIVLATDEEIASLMEITESSTDLGVAGQHRDDADSIATLYEMMAVNPTTQANFFLCVEKLALSSITEEQYITAVQNQIAGLYAGYTITYNENRERDLCGYTFLESGYYLEDYDGISLYQTYLVRKQDGRMIGIVLSYTDESELETLLSGFSAVS